MEYGLIKELQTPTKVYKKLYLFDLGFVAIYFFLLMVFGRDYVHTALHIPFYVFNFIVALILTTHSPFNPQKRIFQSIFFVIKKDRSVYQPISTKAVDSEILSSDIL